ncbi:hypothetical protein HII36_49490 [Nonomuraea sp. NN258]|uniref:hypothetical protein n=1 Tax=Nonomuraea antri TaxID=2730852 RepID=UPI0015693859|nr:hypothetical protein [Nonomuraea antri]NRQ39812.1 hypothetical protein [Nonomuraea antri]
MITTKLIVDLTEDKDTVWCDDELMSINAPTGRRPPLTPRMKFGLKMSEREAELLKMRADFDRQRTRTFQETGVRQSGKESKVSPEEKVLLAELREIAAKRSRVLAQIAAEFEKLKPKQAEFERVRAAARSAGRRKKLPVSEAEQKLRDRIAALQRDRAYVDGSVWHDREAGRYADAVWATCHDPETFDSNDW